MAHRARLESMSVAPQGLPVTGDAAPAVDRRVAPAGTGKSVASPPTTNNTSTAAACSGAGAGAGTGVVLATTGDPAVIPSETVLVFELISPVLVAESG